MLRYLQVLSNVSQQSYSVVTKVKTHEPVIFFLLLKDCHVLDDFSYNSDRDNQRIMHGRASFF